jgi:hypothetical protein
MEQVLPAPQTAHVYDALTSPQFSSVDANLEFEIQREGRIDGYAVWSARRSHSTISRGTRTVGTT